MISVICIVIYKTSGISLVIYLVLRAATWIFLALGLLQSIHTYSHVALFMRANMLRATPIPRGIGLP